MASSFKGWGGSWGDSWGPISVDPNAMAGSALLSFSAYGSLTDGATRRGGGIVKRKRGRYEVDAFADWPHVPSRNDDEECLLLMMI